MFFDTVVKGLSTSWPFMSPAAPLGAGMRILGDSQSEFAGTYPCEDDSGLFPVTNQLDAGIDIDLTWTLSPADPPDLGVNSPWTLANFISNGATHVLVKFAFNTSTAVPVVGPGGVLQSTTPELGSYYEGCPGVLHDPTATTTVTTTDFTVERAPEDVGGALGAEYILIPPAPVYTADPDNDLGAALWEIGSLADISVTYRVQGHGHSLSGFGMEYNLIPMRQIGPSEFLVNGDSSRI